MRDQQQVVLWTTTCRPYAKDDPLQPAGLVGPVRLEVQRGLSVHRKEESADRPRERLDSLVSLHQDKLKRLLQS